LLYPILKSLLKSELPPDIDSVKDTPDVSFETRNEFETFQLFNLFSQSKYDTPLQKNTIYHDSTHLTERFILTIALFAARFNLSDVCLNELLKLFKFFLPSPNEISLDIDKYKFKDLLRERNADE
jgi:hypothetical protein